MKTATVTYAESHLATLLTAVEAGEDILILREGQPVARIVREVNQSMPSIWSELHDWVASAPSLHGPTVSELRARDLL